MQPRPMDLSQRKAGQLAKQWDPYQFSDSIKSNVEIPRVGSIARFNPNWYRDLSRELGMKHLSPPRGETT